MRNAICLGFTNDQSFYRLEVVQLFCYFVLDLSKNKNVEKNTIVSFSKYTTKLINRFILHFLQFEKAAFSKKHSYHILTINSLYFNSVSSLIFKYKFKEA